MRKTDKRGTADDLAPAEARSPMPGPARSEDDIRLDFRSVSLSQMLRENRIAFFLIAGAIVIAAVNMARFTSFFPGCFPADDAYIILAYSKNAAMGHFFEYNSGEKSTGISSPLYALAVAGAKFLVADWHHAVLLLGWVTMLALLGVGFAFAHRALGLWTASVFVLLIASSGRLAYHACMGMESALFALAGLTTFYFFIRRWHVAAGLMAGASFLVRPEGMFVAAAMAAVALIEALPGLIRERRIRSLQPAMLLCAGFAAAVVPWVLYCLSVNGTPLHNTIYWKKQTPSLQQSFQFGWNFLFLEFPYVNEFLASDLRSWVEALKLRIPFVAIAAVGAVLLALRRRDVRLGAAILFSFLCLASRCLMCVNVPDWHRYHGIDYLVVFFYLSALLVMILRGLTEGLVRWLGSWMRPRPLFMAGVVCGSVLIAVLMIQDWQRHLIRFARGAQYHYQLDIRIGLWLRDNTPPNTRVAVYQAGGIKFFSDRYVADFGGLNDHRLWPYIREHRLGEAIAKWDIDYVAPFGEDWLLADGVDVRDPRYFERIDLPSRGLYRVKKDAVRARWLGVAPSGGLR